MNVLLLYILLTMSSSINSCKEYRNANIYEYGCENCTVIRTYTNCNDSTTYIDSIFSGKYLRSINEIQNNYRQGSWKNYNNSGYLTRNSSYTNDFLLKDCFYDINGKLITCSEFNRISDSVQYTKNYNSNNFLWSEGAILIDTTMEERKCGQWIFYDETNGNRTVRNFIPESKSDTTYTTDSLTGYNYIEIITVPSTIDGTETVYDKYGRVLSVTKYAKGIKK